MPLGMEVGLGPGNFVLDGDPAPLPKKGAEPLSNFRPIIYCGECTTIPTGLNRGQAVGASLQKILKSHSIPISTKIRLMKAPVWPVVMYGCESWTLRKNEETRLGAFEMKGLRKILRVSWTAKKTNEWVLNKAGVKRELLDTVKARKPGA